MQICLRTPNIIAENRSGKYRNRFVVSESWQQCDLTFFETLSEIHGQTGRSGPPRATPHRYQSSLRIFCGVLRSCNSPSCRLTHNHQTTTINCDSGMSLLPPGSLVMEADEERVHGVRTIIRAKRMTRNQNSLAWGLKLAVTVRLSPSVLQNVTRHLKRQLHRQCQCSTFSSL